MPGVLVYQHISNTWPQDFAHVVWEEEQGSPGVQFQGKTPHHTAIVNVGESPPTPHNGVCTTTTTITTTTTTTSTTTTTTTPPPPQPPPHSIHDAGKQFVPLGGSPGALRDEYNIYCVLYNVYASFCNVRSMLNNVEIFYDEDSKGR